MSPRRHLSLPRVSPVVDPTDQEQKALARRIDDVFMELEGYLRDFAVPSADAIGDTTEEDIDNRFDRTEERLAGLFVQAFDNPVEDHWELLVGDLDNISYPPNGRSGGTAFRKEGRALLAFPTPLAFDDERLYRFRSRARVVTKGGGAGDDWFNFGVLAVDVDDNFEVRPVGANHPLDTEGEWVYFTHYVRGTGVADGIPRGVSDPSVLDEDTVAIRPFFEVNSDDQGGVMEVDFIAIDVLTASPEVDVTETFGNIVANRIDADTLSAIAADVGVLTSGRIEDPSGLYGVLLSGQIPGEWERWLNLVDPDRAFLRHEKLKLLWDGSISFGGSLVDEDGKRRAIMRGAQTGQVTGADDTANDGEVDVTFSNAFLGTPSVFLMPHRISMPGSGEKLLLQAVNRHPGGFTLKAQHFTPGSPSSEFEDFPAGNDLTANGASTDTDLDPGGAIGDEYTVHYSVSVTAFATFDEPNSVSVEVSILGSDDNGSTFPHVLHSQSYDAFTDGSAHTEEWDHEQKTVNLSGITDIRIEITNVITGGSGGSFSVHGFNQPTDGDPEHGVTYTVDTGASVDTAIPDDSDTVRYLAFEA